MKKLLTALLALTVLTATAQTLPEAGKVYRILSKQYAGKYICEEADGTLVVGDLDNSLRQFWEFVPTGADQTYYIQNKVTGHYIQSCNGTDSNQSIMHTGTTAVPYYVGVRESGANQGYVWFSSTDCADYNNQNATPHGLNKDGASSNIIIWKAGSGNNGSHWSLVETVYAYGIQPFTVSPAIGQPSALYHLVADGKYIDADLKLAEPSEEKHLNWYFIGEGNGAGGYQLVNESKGEPLLTLSGTDRWIVNEDINTSSYYFTSAANSSERLDAEGKSLITFKAARSSFARNNQIYDLPCGKLANSMYVSSASIVGDAALHTLTYPIRLQTGLVKSSTQQTIAPTSWYKLNVLDKPTLRKGRSCDLTLKLCKDLVGGEGVYVYFDWNRDGVFETMYALTPARTMTQEVLVPADASTGTGRMRVRVTYNGLEDADAEVQGQCIDFAMDVVEDDGHEFTASVSPNDPIRGTTEIKGDTAVATPLGNATFICWKEGKRYAAVSKNYRFGTLTHDLHLTGIFAADAQDPYGDLLTGIDQTQVVDLTEAVEISIANSEIRVKTDAPLYGICLYNTEGRLVKQTKEAVISTEGLAPAVYIVRAITAKNGKTVKVSVK